jgi:hypothetical protein
MENSKIVVCTILIIFVCQLNLLFTQAKEKPRLKNNLGKQGAFIKQNMINKFKKKLYPATKLGNFILNT